MPKPTAMGSCVNLADAAEKSREIVGQSVLCAGYAGAGDEIEKTGGHGGDFGEALVGGSGSGEKNRVEMMRGENTAIVVGLFGSEIGDEDAVGAGVCGSAGEFFQAHLQDGIVIAEEDEGTWLDLRISRTRSMTRGERRVRA